MALWRNELLTDRVTAVGLRSGRDASVKGVSHAVLLTAVFGIQELLMQPASTGAVTAPSLTISLITPAYTTQFEPVIARCGTIEKVQTGISVVYNLACPSWPNTGKDLTGMGTTHTHEWRGYLSFDTSTLPNNASVVAVRFYWSRGAITTDGNGPDDWRTTFKMGDFIGDALDIGDWGESGAYTCMEHDWDNPVSPDWTIWLDFPSGANAYVNLLGYTDVAVVDTSLESPPYGSWHCPLYYYGAPTCYLEVTYYLLPKPLTGLINRRCVVPWGQGQ